MSYLEGALPSMEELLNTAAGLGGEDVVEKSTEAALDSGGLKNVLVGVDPNKLNEPARIGFINGIIKHLKKMEGI